MRTIASVGRRIVGSGTLSTRRSSFPCQTTAFTRAVAGLDVLHLGAGLLDDPHRLVADDVALLHRDSELRVEGQVGAAGRGGGDADDRVGGTANRGFGDVVDAQVFLPVPDDGFHAATSSGGVGALARSWMPRITSSSASPELPRGSQPSSSRAR